MAGYWRRSHFASLRTSLSLHKLAKKELSAITQNTGTLARLAILQMYRDAAFIPRSRLLVVCSIFSQFLVFPCLS